MTREEFILNESNQLNKKFVSACGEGYQSLWNNSSPSVTYKTITEFDKVKDAIKKCQEHLKGPKYETTMGQGGIPGGYSFRVGDVWEVDVDNDVSKFQYNRQFAEIGAKKINFVGSSGMTEDDSLKLQAGFVAVMSKENFDKITPDVKDISRANDIFQKDRTANNKAINQLISIKDPIKFIRRVKAIAVAEAIRNKDYYYGSNSFDNGIKNWFNEMLFIGNYYIGKVFAGLKTKYNIDIDKNIIREFSSILKNYTIEELIKMYPNNKI